MATPKLSELKQSFSYELEKSLDAGPSKRLNDAINYALCSEGKRLRPLLVFAAAHACASRANKALVFKRALPAALAVEYIHSYSLIHDDLPAMDDDDYRRGRLSVHRRFDEALAILAGDALQADAFFLLAKTPLNADLQCRELAQASGRFGLVAGQAEDLKNADHQWLLIHAHKTARLFEACAVLGALSQGLSTKEAEKLRSFGHHFGMAFQLKDDVDDNQGLAAQQGTSASLELLQEHLRKALESIEMLGEKTLLTELIELTFLPLN